jgi:hypothetical protein
MDQLEFQQAWLVMMKMMCWNASFASSSFA